tara:strand:- start:76 stop:570 length:495 start_codon:yes stop_codon:yes gene_type:complete
MKDSKITQVTAPLLGLCGYTQTQLTKGYKMLKTKISSAALQSPLQPHSALKGWDTRNAMLTEEFIALNDYKVNEFVIPANARQMTVRPLQILAIGKYRDFDNNGKKGYLHGIRITLKCLETGQAFTVTENSLKDDYNTITLEQWAAELADFKLQALKQSIYFAK